MWVPIQLKNHHIILIITQGLLLTVFTTALPYIVHNKKYLLTAIWMDG